MKPARSKPSSTAPKAPQISAAVSFDAALDNWRRYHREQGFLTGHRLLHGLIAPEEAALVWTRLADETIRYMAAVGEAETGLDAVEVDGVGAHFPHPDEQLDRVEPGRSGGRGGSGKQRKLKSALKPCARKQKPKV